MVQPVAIRLAVCVECFLRERAVQHFVERAVATHGKKFAISARGGLRRQCMRMAGMFTDHEFTHNAGTIQFAGNAIAISRRAPPARLRIDYGEPAVRHVRQ